jgi:hypothetical protein
MPLTLDACNSSAGTDIRVFALHYSGPCHPDTDVFRRLQQRLCETGIVAATELANARRPRAVRTLGNEDDITAAVEGDLWRSLCDTA